MIKLEQPSMVLNDSRTFATVRTSNGFQKLTRRYSMEIDWDVSTQVGRQAVIQVVGDVIKGHRGGKIKNLVINCHGSPGRFLLGKDRFNRNHVNLFSPWKGLIEKIWLVVCNVSKRKVRNTLKDGHLFVSGLAKAAGCYVVASPYIQTGLSKTYPYGMLDTFEGLTQSYAPDGVLSWQRSDSPNWSHNRE